MLFRSFNIGDLRNKCSSYWKIVVFSITIMVLSRCESDRYNLMLSKKMLYLHIIIMFGKNGGQLQGIAKA